MKNNDLFQKENGERRHSVDPIYVFGHRNPDTDSVVSAMAYAALHNSLGDREYVPARLAE